MESWGHFENRSKAALGNKKAAFIALACICIAAMR